MTGILKILKAAIKNNFGFNYDLVDLDIVEVSQDNELGERIIYGWAEVRRGKRVFYTEFKISQIIDGELSIGNELIEFKREEVRT